MPTLMLSEVTPGARVSVIGVVVTVAPLPPAEGELVDLHATSNSAATRVRARYLRTGSSFAKEPRTRLSFNLLGSARGAGSRHLEHQRRGHAAPGAHRRHAG